MLMGELPGPSRHTIRGTWTREYRTCKHVMCRTCHVYDKCCTSDVHVSLAVDIATTAPVCRYIDTSRSVGLVGLRTRPFEDIKTRITGAQACAAQRSNPAGVGPGQVQCAGSSHQLEFNDL